MGASNPVRDSKPYKVNQENKANYHKCQPAWSAVWVQRSETRLRISGDGQGGLADESGIWAGQKLPWRTRRVWHRVRSSGAGEAGAVSVSGQREERVESWNGALSTFWKFYYGNFKHIQTQTSITTLPSCHSYQYFFTLVLSAHLSLHHLTLSPTSTGIF